MPPTTTAAQTYNDVNSYIGVEAWVDARYLVAGIGFGSMISGTYSSTGDWYNFWPSMVPNPPKPAASGANSYQETYLSFVALAKYPFHFGVFSLYPLAGVEYDLNLSYTGQHFVTNAWSTTGWNSTPLAEPGEAGAQTRLFLLGGLGVDYKISGPFFVRAQGLYGYKLQTPGDLNRIASWPNNPIWTTIPPNAYTNGTITAWKVDANISVGYHL